MATQDKINELAARAFAQASTSAPQQITTLLTAHEKITIGRRILIAQSIVAGKTRSEIMALMQISPNTFTQIKQWLDSQLTEYASAHGKAAENTQTEKEPVQHFSYTHLKQTYPGHFLLFSLTEELFKLAKK